MQPSQNPNGSFCRILKTKKSPKIHVQSQRSVIRKTIFKKRTKWSPHNSWFQNKFYIYNNQNSVILEQRQTNRPVRQNRVLRSKFSHIWSLARVPGALTGGGLFDKWFCGLLTFVICVLNVFFWSMIPNECIRILFVLIES